MSFILGGMMNLERKKSCYSLQIKISDIPNNVESKIIKIDSDKRL